MPTISLEDTLKINTQIMYEQLAKAFGTTDIEVNISVRVPQAKCPEDMKDGIAFQIKPGVDIYVKDDSLPF